MAVIIKHLSGWLKRDMRSPRDLNSRARGWAMGAPTSGTCPSAVNTTFWSGCSSGCSAKTLAAVWVSLPLPPNCPRNWFCRQCPEQTDNQQLVKVCRMLTRHVPNRKQGLVTRRQRSAVNIPRMCAFDVSVAVVILSQPQGRTCFWYGWKARARVTASTWCPAASASGSRQWRTPGHRTLSAATALSVLSFMKLPLPGPACSAHQSSPTGHRCPFDMTCGSRLLSNKASLLGHATEAAPATSRLSSQVTRWQQLNKRHGINSMSRTRSCQSLARPTQANGIGEW